MQFTGSTPDPRETGASLQQEWSTLWIISSLTSRTLASFRHVVILLSPFTQEALRTSVNN